MSNEKQNNYEDWKSKLNHLDGLPDESMPDKNEVWEKLHHRLHGKIRSKKTLWYWAAAACILIIIMTPLVHFKYNNNDLPNTQTLNNSIETPTHDLENSPGIIISDKKDSSLNSEPALAITNQLKKEIPSDKKITRQNEQKKITIIRLSDTVSRQNLLADQSNSLSLLDTFQVATTAVPAKKKLKVVHINELGDPVEVSPGNVANTYKHAFQFKIGNQETIVNPAIASNTSGFTILKLKSSQN